MISALCLLVIDLWNGMSVVRVQYDCGYAFLGLVIIMWLTLLIDRLIWM